MEITNQRLARNVRAAMAARGFNNRTLGERVGKPTNWVQKLSSGRKRIYFDELEMVAAALEIPIRVLSGEPQHVHRYLWEHPELVVAEGTNLPSGRLFEVA